VTWVLHVVLGVLVNGASLTGAIRPGLSNAALVLILVVRLPSFLLFTPGCVSCSTCRSQWLGVPSDVRVCSSVETPVASEVRWPLCAYRSCYARSHRSSLLLSTSVTMIVIFGLAPVFSVHLARCLWLLKKKTWACYHFSWHLFRAIAGCLPLSPRSSSCLSTSSVRNSTAAVF